MASLPDRSHNNRKQPPSRGSITSKNRANNFDGVSPRNKKAETFVPNIRAMNTNGRHPEVTSNSHSPNAAVTADSPPLHTASAVIGKQGHLSSTSAITSKNTLHEATADKIIRSLQRDRSSSASGTVDATKYLARLTSTISDINKEIERHKRSLRSSKAKLHSLREDLAHNGDILKRRTTTVERLKARHPYSTHPDTMTEMIEIEEDWVRLTALKIESTQGRIRFWRTTWGRDKLLLRGLKGKKAGLEKEKERVERSVAGT